VQTSNLAPMMGATANGNFAASCSWTRQDRQRNRGQWGNRNKAILAGAQQTRERRAIRRAEALMLADDLADQRADRLDTAEPAHVIDWNAVLDDVNFDAWSLTAEAPIFADAGLAPDTTFGDLLVTILEPADVADPFGDTFDPDDIQWGFRVTSMDKAPGVTSGRPQPTALHDAHN
jgi:hypothetical protein